MLYLPACRNGQSRIPGRTLQRCEYTRRGGLLVRHWPRRRIAFAEVVVSSTRAIYGEGAATSSDYW